MPPPFRRAVTVLSRAGSRALPGSAKIIKRLPPYGAAAAVARRLDTPKNMDGWATCG
jgi:hypothetical protein